MTMLCFSTAAAAAPPSASHPQRPRRDAAAFCGLERPRRRGRAADVCGAKVDAADEDGRGPGRVFGSFWAWL